jgi:hypothetical protein
MTRVTSLGSPSLSTTTLTFTTKDLLLKSQLCDFALVEILQRNLQTVSHVLSTSGTTATTTATAKEVTTSTEKLRKQVSRRHARTSRTIVQAFLTIPVVTLSLLGI